MATDGPTPPPCNQKLFDSGVVAAVCDTSGACAFEATIVGVRDRLGCDVDWHYAAGRAIVLCYKPDFNLVRAEVVKSLGTANARLLQ